MRNGTHRKVITVAAALAAVSLGQAGAEPVASAQPQTPPFRFGASERVRQEFFDHVPVKAAPPAFARGGENDYVRFRTSIWGEFDPCAYATFRVRAVNESRAWLYPDVSQRPERSTSEWPDEWVFDNAYMDLHGLLNNTVDLRVGRQDLIYGTGKVILEGTPGDGSRTIYFNAVKATYKGIPDTKVDLLGIANPAQDPLAINPGDPARDLSAMPKSKDGMRESGAGVYMSNASLKAMPLEAYAFYKEEGTYVIPVKPNAQGQYPTPKLAWQTLDVPASAIDVDSSDIGTVGARLMPKFNDSLSGNLEVAAQFGHRGDADIQAYMADAFVVQQLGLAPEMKPAVDAGVYYLSADDPSTSEDEGWDPIWARYPQFSELYVYGWDTEEIAGRWSNLLTPHAGVTLNPLAKMKTTLSVNYLYAPEADGSGGGHERGWLGVLKNEFTLAEKRWLPKDKLTGHLWLEVLEPGNYYKADDLALFARWELNYQF